VRLARRPPARAVVPVVGALLVGLAAAPAVAAPGSTERQVPTGTPTGTTAGTPAGDTARLGLHLRPGADPAAVARAARGRGAEPAQRLDRFRYLSVAVPARAADEVAAAMARRADVVSVEPVARRQASYVPSDSYWGNQSSYLTAVAAPAAWDVTRGSSAVRIAVVDSGVDVAHPDLAGKVVGRYNSTPGAVTTDVTDQLGHGTHVAGIAAAASDNGTGVVGTGFHASILAVKAGGADGFWDDDLAKGITWSADNGAHVINMSLGGYSTTSVLNAAVSYAQSKDVVVVAAAGNEATSNMSYPASLPGVVAVGATDAAGNRAEFSNYGDWVTVAAPGVNIFSTLPTAGSTMGTSYAYASGTSMATPVVAGQAALLRAAAPSLTATQVRDALVSTAHGYAGLGLGTGQVDLQASLAAVVPGSAPTITAPGSGDTLSSTATLVATTTAGSVRFRLDGDAFGAPVAAQAGTASTDVALWGLADGSHTVSAKACNDQGCGPESAAVTVTVQNPPGSITAPAGGATVSGLVGVDVTTADAAPQVRLVVDGAPRGAPVAVSGNAAHLEWDSTGFAQGAHTLAVAPCTAEGACGTAAGSVQVLLDNAAPALTSPTSGQLVSGHVTLQAQAGSGGVRFLLDGTPIGFDGTAPYTLAKNFTLVADGQHQLGVQACSADGALCDGSTSVVPVEVKSLHPVVKTVSPGVISPNGDGRADRAAFTYSLPTSQYVSWQVRDAVGAVVRGPVGLGTKGAGTGTLVWDGKTAGGARVASGAYTLWLDTAGKDAQGRTIRGLATRGVRVDAVAPGLSVSAVTSAFYPVADGFRDTVAPKVSVNEPAVVTMTVRNSAGRVVRTATSRRSAAGSFFLAWNGRNNAGTLQPAGTYRYSFLAQDAGLNRRTSSTWSVPLSWKRLYATKVARTVTPVGTMTGSYAGSCSELRQDTTTGSLAYLSAFDYFQAGTCPDWNDPRLDVASSSHQLALPRAVRYAGISIVATGGATDPDFPDTADAWYRDRYGRPSGRVELSATTGSHALGAASPALLYGGYVLRWQVQTDSARWWTATGFTVRYTYYVLR